MKFVSDQLNMVALQSNSHPHSYNQHHLKQILLCVLSQLCYFLNVFNFLSQFKLFSDFKYVVNATLQVFNVFAVNENRKRSIRGLNTQDLVQDVTNLAESSRTSKPPPKKAKKMAGTDDLRVSRAFSQFDNKTTIFVDTFLENSNLRS